MKEEIVGLGDEKENDLLNRGWKDCKLKYESTVSRKKRPDINDWKYGNN